LESVVVVPPARVTGGGVDVAVFLGAERGGSSEEVRGWRMGDTASSPNWASMKRKRRVRRVVGSAVVCALGVLKRWVRSWLVLAVLLYVFECEWEWEWEDSVGGLLGCAQLGKEASGRRTC
jgi:hypothetical protein